MHPIVDEVFVQQRGMRGQDMSQNALEADGKGPNVSPWTQVVDWIIASSANSVPARQSDQQNPTEDSGYSTATASKISWRRMEAAPSAP